MEKKRSYYLANSSEKEIKDYPFVIVYEGWYENNYEKQVGGKYGRAYEFFSKMEFVECGKYRFYRPGNNSSQVCFCLERTYVGYSDYCEQNVQRLSAEYALKLVEPYLEDADNVAQAFRNCFSRLKAEDEAKKERERREREQKAADEATARNQLNSILGEIKLPDIPPQKENPLNPPQQPAKSEGCYVATCVYGSYDCPEVWTLRRFRDGTLDNTWYGRLFIKCYYAISPALVKLFGNAKWFRLFWKNVLDNFVKMLNTQGVDNTPYFDKF